MQTTRRDTLLLFAAIVAHKPFDSMAVATRLYKRGCPPWLVSILLLPTFVVPFIGVLVGIAVSKESDVVMMVFTALTVGCFLVCPHLLLFSQIMA
jgi:zinc transporter ZupT